MRTTNASRVITLLKGIETGDPTAVDVISPDRYIQHNPQTQEGRDGLAALFQRLSKTNPRVNIVRIFEDGDYVFAHTEYDFSSRRIGFEVFRFKDGYAVEHWDNIQPRKGPNVSGRSMVDGSTEVTDLDLTETNRSFVGRAIERLFVERQLEQIDTWIDGGGFVQHAPNIGDGIGALRSFWQEKHGDGYVIAYNRLHRVLAQGNFALAVSEGAYEGRHSSFYDLFRVAEDKIVEHWNTIEAVPAAEEWQNENGKF